MSGSTRAERLAVAVAASRPHDLLELASPDALVAGGPAPAWVAASLARAPFVVVRRALRRGPLVPVGVRGSTRGERFGCWLPADRAVRHVRPEDLAARRGWESSAALPLSALRAVEAILGAERLRWGPVGSVGFELATGVPCAGPGSDVDVIVRAAAPPRPELARRLRDALAALPVRVDVLVEIPGGAVALAECAAGGARLVLRTAAGVRWMVAPPSWAEARP